MNTTETKTTPALAEKYAWKPNAHGRHSRLVGTLTLKAEHVFTQYGNNAADTDYVTCAPQKVPVYQHGDDYWLCAQFKGTLTATTCRREIGAPAVAHIQTQSWGGVRDWLRAGPFELDVENPELEIAIVGSYDDGSAMLAVRKIRNAALAA
jgi:hypothetical protein